MNLNHKVKVQLQKFCKLLPKTKAFKWNKFEFLYTAEESGKGSWIGVYYMEIEDGNCQFISHHMKYAFKLMPDTYVLRLEESSSFLGVDKDIKLVQVQRGIQRTDYMAIMGLCNYMSRQKGQLLKLTM